MLISDFPESGMVKNEKAFGVLLNFICEGTVKGKTLLGYTIDQREPGKCKKFLRLQTWEQIQLFMVKDISRREKIKCSALHSSLIQGTIYKQLSQSSVKCEVNIWYVRQNVQRENYEKILLQNSLIYFKKHAVPQKDYRQN